MVGMRQSGRGAKKTRGVQQRARGGPLRALPKWLVWGGEDAKRMLDGQLNLLRSLPELSAIKGIQLQVENYVREDAKRMLDGQLNLLRSLPELSAIKGIQLQVENYVREDFYSFALRAEEVVTKLRRALEEVDYYSLKSEWDGSQLIPPEAVVTVFSGLLVFMVFAALGGLAGEEGGNSEWAKLAASEGEEEPNCLKVYNPAIAKSYFSQRPITLLKRGWRSSVLLGWFSLCIWIDAKTNKRPEDDEDVRAATDAKRARQLKNLLIRLGPTYVKLGQVLSSRQDLLPTPYVKELQTLQDSVPPFDDFIAYRMVERELGAASAVQLEYLSASPIASASLGQVYQCRDLKSGKKVAVKVQRPGALSAVSLDVAIIRIFGPPLYAINEKNGNLDVKGLIDEWGSRFVDELDYRKEAENAQKFQKAMDSRRRNDELGKSVFVPVVCDELSSRRVLTAQWVEGCRLDEIGDEKQTKRLCALTLAAYLSMLLETGTLHVDPHPGNLLYTSDSRLCILDWGLVTTISQFQRDAILQFIAHLVSGDYATLDNDLANMGFVPPEKLEALNDAGLTRAIGTIFSAAAGGGGAQGFRRELGFTQSDEELRAMGKELRKIKGKNKKETEVLRRNAFLEMTGGQNSKVGQLSKDLEGVQEKYGNVFTIPTYFAHILRSFSVLEGIGLAIDPNYSITQQAFPFTAYRLLTDGGQNTKLALKTLLYGGEDKYLSIPRAKQLAEAFGTYSEIMTPPLRRQSVEDAEEEADAEDHLLIPPGLKAASRLVFQVQGNPIQEILLEETARLTATSAAVRLNETLATLFQEGGVLHRQDEAMRGLFDDDQLPLLPPSPYKIYERYLGPGLEALASKGGDDSDAVEVVSILANAVANPKGMEEIEEEEGKVGDIPRGGMLPSLPTTRFDQLEEAMELAWELAPGIGLFGLRLASTVMTDGVERLGQAVDAIETEAAAAKKE